MTTRLSTVQRMILTYMLDQAKQGKPTIIADGHKKTRVGYFPALQAEGVATNSTTVFFLRHHGLIEEVRSGASPLKGEEAYEERRYRLTAKGEQLLGAPKPSGVGHSMEQWKRRTRA